MADLLSLRCDGSHSHVRLEGGTRTKRAASYPVSLVPPGDCPCFKKSGPEEELSKVVPNLLLALRAPTISAQVPFCSGEQAFNRV